MNKLKIIGVLAKLYLNRDHIKKNWKTTLLGFISGLAVLLANVDFDAPVEWTNFILPVLLVLWGVVQKDKERPKPFQYAMARKIINKLIGGKNYDSSDSDFNFVTSIN